jgi:transposase
MMGPGANARVYLACGVTDMRKGIDGLTALVQTALRQKPASGSVFVFRGRRGQRPTFCIRFSFRDDRISVASAVWERGAGFAVSARQEPDVHLYGQAARSIP